jgi:lambda family phage portal protein
MQYKARFGRKEFVVNETFLDRVYRVFAPEKAAKRIQSRLDMAFMGQYTGASKSRRSLSAFSPLGQDANADLLPDLPVLRQRSRDLERNAPLATGAINTNVTTVIGGGLKVKPTIMRDMLDITDEQADEFEKQAKALFSMWAKSSNCDLSRKQNFYDSQDMVYRSVLVSGDICVITPSLGRAGDPFKLKLQFIEADRLENPNFLTDTDKLAGGIELDANGAPLFYYFLKQHPGTIEGIGSREYIKVRAFGAQTGRKMVLHVFDRKRPGQVRGIPYLAPVIELVKQLTRYTEAEVMAAVVSGMFTVFIKSDTNSQLSPFQPDDETGSQSSDDDYKLGNGAIVQLDGNDSIETANPGRPNTAFDPFVLAVLRQIGVALEIPYELLIKHFTASYTAARASVMEAWRYFTKRRSFIVNEYCQPVYEAFIDEMVATGRLKAPDYFKDPLVRAAYLGAEWIGRPQGQLDPLKEGNANQLSVEHGWKTNEQVTSELTGGEWETNIRQRAKENDLKAELMTAPQAAIMGEDTEEEAAEEGDMEAGTNDSHS